MTRNNKKKQTRATSKPQKKILASAQIKHGQDTDVLSEDLFNEAILDKNGRSAQLVKNKWVLMFDEKQSFLKNLMSLLNNSTTLRNVTNAKTAFTLGDGFQAVEADTIPILKSIKKLVRKFSGDSNKLQGLNDCLTMVNPAGETLEDVSNKIIFDFCAFGNAFAELVKTTESGQPVVYLYHVPVYKVGLEKQNKRGFSENFGICQDWQNLGNKAENIEVVPRYPQFSKGAAKRSIIHLKQYAAGFDYFGLPEWISARLWANIEYRIPKYNITKFKNGFVPSAIMQFFGAMNEDEAAELIKGIDATFSDTGKNSKIFAQVLRDESYKADVQILEDKNAGSFLDLNKLASQAIVTASRWTMSLAGFATSGKLGTNQQIRDEIELVTNTVIKQIRRLYLQKIANVFIKELSTAKSGEFKGLQLEIANLTPVSVASKIDPEKSLLTSEKRNLLGYDTLDEEQEKKLQQEQQSL
jgi:capsid portal protein